MNTRTLLLLGALATLAHGQSFIAKTTEPTKDGFGGLLLVVDDLDGDGLADLATSDLLAPNGPESGDVRLLAGDDLAALLTIPGGAPYETLGASLATLGDLNGDGVPEIVAHARFDTPSHHGKQAGMVRVYSGADGTLLQQLDGTNSEMDLGYQLGSAGDIDGDGLQDLLASTFKPAATTRIYSSGTWQVLAALPGTGLALTPGDLDLDGVPDVLIADPFFGSVSCFSGGNGRMLLQVVKTGGFGTSVAAMGDLDGDGVPDIAVGAPQNGGSVRTISGATGQDLLVTFGHQAGAGFGTAIANAGDVDGDGLADLVIGTPGADIFPGPGFGGGWVQVRSSHTGEILTHFNGAISGQGYGATLVAGRDLQGDGFPDLAVGDADGGALTSLVQTASARFRVAQLAPSAAIWSVPTLIQVHGAGFDPGAPVAVTVQGLPATAASCLSPTLIEFTTPVGVEDTAADVILSQDGLNVLLPGALKLIGPEILDVYPPIISKAGGATVNVLGTHFPTDGSAVVQFHLGVGALQSIEETGAVAIAPPFTPGAPWEVRISGSTGSGTNENFTFKYSDSLGSPNRGNITGGTTVLLSGTAVGHKGGTPTVKMGNGTCTILDVTKTTLTIVTPGQAEATGELLSAGILDPVKGNETIPMLFLYTPFLKSTYLPDVLGGGRLRLQWFTSPDAVQPQLVTTWAGAPGAPTVNMSFAAFAGVLHVQPWEYLTYLQPMPQPLHMLEFSVPVYDPLAIGLTLKLQSHVTGEGYSKGSFTNSVTLTLP